MKQSVPYCRLGTGFSVLVCLLLLCPRGLAREAGKLRLSEWDRGIALTAPSGEDMTVYLWFYEWNLFGAVYEGENTYGTRKNTVSISEDGRAGTIVSGLPGLSLEAQVDGESADLRLKVTNLTGRDWPELAAIIPCFNPGPKQIRNPAFSNEKTFFVGPEGLKLLSGREIHYGESLRRKVDEAAHQWEHSLDPHSQPGDRFPWSFRWPDSDVDAGAGLIVRESNDGAWVAGIAWERYLSVQAHNPWECMHLSVHLGPLKQGESRQIRGKIYLFQGTKEELLARYHRDFGAN